MDWRGIVKSVAPTIGTALGGPIAGIATKFIADKLLGDSGASEDTVEAAILSATPDQLIKLKELDIQFKQQMVQAGIDVFKLEVQDRESARNREAATHDKTPMILAIVFVSIYLFFSFYIMKNNLFSEPVQIFISNLTNIVMLIMSYYFGSSAGSRIKDITNSFKK